MTDNLRDRIAAVLLNQYSAPKYGDDFVLGKAHWLADAVIAALRELDDQCGDCFRRGDERDGCNCVYPKGHPSRD